MSLFSKQEKRNGCTEFRNAKEDICNTEHFVGLEIE